MMKVKVSKVSDERGELKKVAIEVPHGGRRTLGFTLDPGDAMGLALELYRVLGFGGEWVMWDKVDKTAPGMYVGRENRDTLHYFAISSGDDTDEMQATEVLCYANTTRPVGGLG